MFVKRLDNEGPLPRVTRVRAQLLGSLGATGHGHSSPKAVLLGLEGQVPATVDVRGGVEPDLARIRESGRLRLLGTEKGAEAEIAFTEDHALASRFDEARCPAGIRHLRSASDQREGGLTRFCFYGSRMHLSSEQSR
ncbi:hypothetical protein BIV23_42145 [Streptomyces monashensis]|uniref:Serine dehydratase beta chain domain-containing protein n=1 Tax=Streptomyces monashensis TaxID=1678012 RepID=A0A1S2P5S6_9ACTN|nr:hypothetical protein BIV23_42145 [Streptomyces monashensis]